MRRIPTVVVAAAIMLLTAACGPDESEEPTPDEAAQTPQDEVDEPEETDDAPDDQGPDDEAADEPPEPALSVVATVAPVTDLVAMVGGERVEVTSLVPAGADSHTYEPRPGDVAVLAEADAYLGIGLALNDGALRLAEENLPEGAPTVRLGELGLDEEHLVLDHAHGDDGHTHGEDGHTHGDDGHTHGDELGPNPHVWTSVRNAMRLVDTIADVLTDLDPEGAGHYAGRAEEARSDLTALDERIASATATIPEEHRTLVTYHDAWTYFARDYDLDYATAVQPADFSEPSAAEVRAIIDLVRQLEVPAVFGSEVFPSTVLETIAEETGAAYVADLADDVLPGAPGDPEHTYLELMRRNAITIVDALGGDADGLR